MKLCEHIRSIYQNEIAHGNRPLFVSTPKYVDKFATAELYVIMKNKLQDYHIEKIQEGCYTDYRFPRERYFGCPVCGHYISGPMEESQADWFACATSMQPNAYVKATADNVYVEDGAWGKQMIPVFSLK